MGWVAQVDSKRSRALVSPPAAQRLRRALPREPPLEIENRQLARLRRQSSAPFPSS